MVLGKEAHLDIDVADDQWHHVAITWSSHTGQYTSYRDGALKSSDVNLEKGQVWSHLLNYFYVYLYFLFNV